MAISLGASAVLAAPAEQAEAATGLTVKNYTAMPFFNARQLAASAIFGDDSSTVAVGGAGRCDSIWKYPDQGFAITKAGQGVLLSNVGTDLDGDAYDLKIVATRVIGTNTDYGIVSIDVWDFSDKLLESGERPSIALGSRKASEADFTVSFLKHGTSKAANVSACPTFYDIDSSNWGVAQPDLLFNGAEGISLAGNTGTCYVTYDEDMAIDASKGNFYTTTDWSTGATGKDPKAAVTMLTNSSSFTVTFSGYHAGVDMTFDPYTAISPSKSATITG